MNYKPHYTVQYPSFERYTVMKTGITSGGGFKRVLQRYFIGKRLRLLVYQYYKLNLHTYTYVCITGDKMNREKK